MSQHTADDTQPVTIYYEVVPENEQEADPAEMQAVANQAVAVLRNEGHTVNPVATGTLGGDLLYQIVPFVQMAVAHKDEIAHTVETVKPLVERLLSWRKQQQDQQVALSALGALEVEMSFGSDTFKFKSSGSEGTGEFSNALDTFVANSTQTRQPLSNVHIRQQVPARPRRKRR